MRYVIFLCTLEFLLIFLEFVSYYLLGNTHSKVPFILASCLLGIVTIITGMALYESIKHRNDSEPW